MSGRSRAVFHDPAGRVITHYEFGGVTFNITGAKKPRINGFNNDQFGSEHELLSAYDDTGQGADLFRCYADGSQVKLRPRETPNAESP
jgi:hypothetical protein